MSTDRPPPADCPPPRSLASALAAVTATVAASYLGVAGTVIGAGVASVLTVVGNAVYSHSLRRVARMRTAAGGAPAGAGRRAEHPAVARRAASWPMFAAASAGVFVGVLAVVTVVELVAGPAAERRGARPLGRRARRCSATSVRPRGPRRRRRGPRARSAPPPAVTVDRDAARRHPHPDRDGHRCADDRDADPDRPRRARRRRVRHADASPTPAPRASVRFDVRPP